MKGLIVALVAALLAAPVLAQSQVELDAPAGQQVAAPDPQALADIRAEIGQLSAEINALRSELALNDPAVSGIANTGPVLSRVDVLESELRLLTDQVEELGFRIERIVADGTNRIGDLEFRLLELEGGDFSTLNDPVPLGQGDTTPRERPTPTAAGRPEAAPDRPVANLGQTRPRVRDTAALAGATPDPIPQDTAAVTPQPVPVPQPEPQPQPEAAASDDAGAETFRQALTALRGGDHFTADQLFSRYLSSYPNSPRAGEASFWRGEALSAQNNWQLAARSYLDSFSGSPNGAYAADALYRLGVSLGRLGQVDQACRTLNEVPLRYSGITADLTNRIAVERASLGCG